MYSHYRKIRLFDMFKLEVHTIKTLALHCSIYFKRQTASFWLLRLRLKLGLRLGVHIVLNSWINKIAAENIYKERETERVCVS